MTKLYRQKISELCTFDISDCSILCISVLGTVIIAEILVLQTMGNFGEKKQEQKR